MTLRGDLVTFKATFQSDEGGYADPTTVVVDIVRPDGSLAVNGAAPTRHPSLGQYEHDFPVPLDAPIGRWKIQWRATYLTIALPLAWEDFEVFLVQARFAEFDELEASLGSTVPDDRVAQANEALLNATAAIRGYTHQLLSYVSTETITLDPRGRACLHLPELPVLAVTAVTEKPSPAATPTALTLPDDITWDPVTGQVWKTNEQRWTTTRLGVAFTYAHGYQPLPQELITVCLERAKREYENPAAMRQESIGGMSRTHAQPSGFTEDEERVLDRYRYCAIA